MKWNLNWINRQAAIKELAEKGKTLADYPWPEDEQDERVIERGVDRVFVEYGEVLRRLADDSQNVIDRHHHSDFCVCNPKRRVEPKLCLCVGRDEPNPECPYFKE